ncbi:MAG: hypothetical protein ABIJ45_07055, partial [Candidatus Zixiibacteriota bacterium]
MRTTLERLAIAILIVIFSGSLWAGIIEVPKDAETIQIGLNIASDNDTLLVEPGFYVENLNYLGKDVVILAFG